MLEPIALPAWEMLADIGLYMDQVVTLTERVLPLGGITKAMVNNYVKNGLLPRPVGKKYDREHLALLLEIGVLKQAMSMEHIARLLSGLNAQGVEAGYARFLSALARVDAGIRGGALALGDEADALGMVLCASLCTLHARAMLDGMKAR